MSWVYFFQEPSGLIKIGFSRNPESRIYNVRAESGVKGVVALGKMPGSRMLERAIHLVFEHDRAVGPLGAGKTEWFRPSELLLNFINRRTTPLRPPGRRGVRISRAAA